MLNNNNQRFIEIADILVEFYDLLDQHHEGDLQLSQDDLNFIELGIDSLTTERLQLQSTLADYPRPQSNFSLI